MMAPSCRRRRDDGTAAAASRSLPNQPRTNVVKEMMKVGSEQEGGGRRNNRRAAANGRRGCGDRIYRMRVPRSLADACPCAIVFLLARTVEDTIGSFDTVSDTSPVHTHYMYSDTVCPQPSGFLVSLVKFSSGLRRPHTLRALQITKRQHNSQGRLISRRHWLRAAGVPQPGRSSWPPLDIPPYF